MQKPYLNKEISKRRNLRKAAMTDATNEKNMKKIYHICRWIVKEEM